MKKKCCRAALKKSHQKSMDERQNSFSSGLSEKASTEYQKGESPSKASVEEFFSYYLFGEGLEKVEKLHLNLLYY